MAGGLKGRVRREGYFGSVSRGCHGQRSLCDSVGTRRLVVNGWGSSPDLLQFTFRLHSTHITVLSVLVWVYACKDVRVGEEFSSLP